MHLCDCVCVCVVYLLSVYFPPPEVINAQAKVLGEHAVLFNQLNPRVIPIATETEGGEKCHFTMCMLTDTQHSLMYLRPILASVDQLDVYIIDTMSGHFVSHSGIYHWQHIYPVYMILSRNQLLFFAIVFYIAISYYHFVFLFFIIVII